MKKCSQAFICVFTSRGINHHIIIYFSLLSSAPLLRCILLFSYFAKIFSKPILLPCPHFKTELGSVRHVPWWGPLVSPSEVKPWCHHTISTGWFVLWSHWGRGELQQRTAAVTLFITVCDTSNCIYTHFIIVQFNLSLYVYLSFSVYHSLSEPLFAAVVSCSWTKQRAVSTSKLTPSFNRRSEMNSVEGEAQCSLLPTA